MRRRTGATRLAVLIACTSAAAFARGQDQGAPSVPPTQPAQPAPHETVPPASPDAPGVPAAPGGPRIRQMMRLDAFLYMALERFKVPGMVACAFNSAGILGVGAAGVQELGTDRVLRMTNPLHIGSCTKAFTATVVAMLVDGGRLRWDTTLAEALPDAAPTMHEAYKRVTVAQLMHHRAGLASFTDGSAPEFALTRGLAGDGRAQRAAFAKAVLSRPPAHTPGDTFEYSNAGYGVAGAIAERAGNDSWENLVRRLIFEPLRMDASGFGWPATPEDPQRPLGHVLEGEALAPYPVNGDYRLPAALAPAGDIHASMYDMLAFGVWQLRGLRGQAQFLSEAGFNAIHTPDRGYAMGWMGGQWDGQRATFHNGSAGTFFAIMILVPGHDMGVVVMANSGNAEEACEAVMRDMLKRFGPQDPGPGPVPPDGAAPATPPAGQGGAPKP